MVGVGNEFFVQLPGDTRRRMLLPATVVGFHDDIFTARPEAADSALTDDAEVLVYFNRGRDFVKQAACITEVQDDADGSLFLFETVGDPVSAESRECFRVSTVAADATARLGKEDACQLLDISATGFAVAATERYDIAAVVQATLIHEDQEFSGAVCVQSVRELRRGKLRYGVSCVTGNAATGNLSAGVRLVSAAAQRAQLRRLSATA